MLRKISGFSFVELLITLIIIGVLSAIAFPNYSQHVVQVKRLEATTSLSKLAVALEQYYTYHHSYQGASLAELGFQKTVSNNYQLIIALATDNRFEIMAQPIDHQAQKDSLCGTLTLDSLGTKGISGNGKITECW